MVQQAEVSNINLKQDIQDRIDELRVELTKRCDRFTVQRTLEFNIEFLEALEGLDG